MVLLFSLGLSVFRRLHLFAAVSGARRAPWGDLGSVVVHHDPIGLCGTDSSLLWAGAVDVERGVDDRLARGPVALGGDRPFDMNHSRFGTVSLGCAMADRGWRM
jgi:hypothetical protein